ncbi:MAG: allophanate hydrolase subunit 1 [Lawsonibacter sp.]
MPEFNIKPVGDCALCAEFKNEISVAVNQQVHALDRVLSAAAIPGVVETVPAYRTLIVHYRPELICYQALHDRLLALTDLPAGDTCAGSQVIELPVLYGGEVDFASGTPHYDGWDGRETAPDLSDVLTHEQISQEEFVRRHTANLCYIYFQAFAIGHSYVGNPVKTFTVPRRTTPRTKIPQGSIAIWADQTVLNGFDLPCGWQVIGRTPVLLYDNRKQPASYCLSGQWVKFVPIDQAEFARIRKLALAGEYRPVTYERKAGV